MAYLQNWFGLHPADIATILSWSESLDKPLATGTVTGFLSDSFGVQQLLYWTAHGDDRRSTRLPLSD